MEAKLPKPKPKGIKQKAKLQQIMSITIENLSKKGKPSEQVEEKSQEFNKVSEEEYQQQLDAYLQEQNKRFSFSQPTPDPYQVQIMQQQNQFQQTLNKQQDFQQSPKQQPLGQSQQLKNQPANVNESHLTNITQQSPVFIPQLHMSQVNQQSCDRDNTKKSSQNQDELFQINSQLDDSQDIPQVQKMSIKSDNIKKQSKQQTNNISNILDNFLSHRQKNGDQSGLNQSELFEFSNLQHFGGGNDDQSVIQQQSLLQSIHNDTQQFPFEEISQNNRKESIVQKSLIGEPEDDVNDILQELYECTTKQIPKKIIESNAKMVNQKGKEVMHNIFQQKPTQQQQIQQNNQNIPYLTGSKIISDQKTDSQSPIVKSNLQQEINISTAQQIKQEMFQQNESNFVSQFGGIAEIQKEKVQEIDQKTIQNQQPMINAVQQPLKQSTIQEKLKNSIKINDAEQPISTQQNTKPFQISSTDRNYKAKQAFGYELTFRTPQKGILGISQYLFKYSKLNQEPNLKRLQEIKIDNVQKYYQEHKILCESFDLEQFEQLLQEKDPEFLALCKTNLILYQQGESLEQQNKWSKTFLSILDLNSYLFSLGFTYDQQTQIKLILQVEEYQTKYGKTDASQLEIDGVYFAIYLAFKYYPDYQKLLDSIQFPADSETKLLDIDTIKIVLGKLVTEDEINNVFKWSDKKIPPESLYKVLTLLPY